MAKRLHIPSELLILNPTLTMREIRSLIQIVLKSRANIIRNSTVLDIRIPGLGRIKSHGNKRKPYQKALLRDRKRKRLEKRRKDLELHNLLF